MYFNIPEQLFEKYEDSYPDILSEVAKIYDEFKGSFKDEDIVLLYFNQHLKLFPIIESWKNELFFQWDICRQSLICSKAVVKEFCVNFEEDDISVERIHKEMLAEYYLDNISFRVFSILDKVGHPLNLTLNLGFKVREVSYHKIREKIFSLDDWPVLKQIFSDFEQGDNLLADFKEYRNSLTHRSHLLQPRFELDDIEIDLGKKNENGLNGKIKANTVKRIESELKITDLFKVVEGIYNRLTTFLKNIFIYNLNEIIKRYENESKL